MHNKQMLIDLIEKYRDALHNNNEYVMCEQILKKVGRVILTYNTDANKLDLAPLNDLTDDEISMFEFPDSKRIILSLREISKKRGWRVETVIKLVDKLKEDITENKIKEFTKKENSLDELFKIIEEGLFKDNYNLILDFIKISLESQMISVNDAININFYVLKEANLDKKNEDELEIIELQENGYSEEDVVKNLNEIFSKYGYVYDRKVFGSLDEKFIKYVNISYVDYVLSKFLEYGIDNDMLHMKIRAFYGIVVDNDKETFDSMLNFIDNNDCSLNTLLSIPSVFVRGKRAYVEKDMKPNGEEGENYTIVGANGDFFDNIALYKERLGISSIKDEDLYRTFKFLCTPSLIVKKNIALLEQYGIIKKGELPKAIVSLCGKNTEYLIDRFIEAGLYEAYLIPRVTPDGEIRPPRGTSSLDWDKSLVRFYKMKRARDIGDSIFSANAGIRKVFKDDDVFYNGIGLVEDEKGNTIIGQTPLSLKDMNNIDPRIRKSLPKHIKHKINEGEIDKDNVELVLFDTLYKYRVYNASSIFSSDKSLIGERIEMVFKNDFSKVLTNEDIENVQRDYIINLLDNSAYCDSLGNSKRVKLDELKYEFSHPSIPNVNVLVSRYKVLRLCKLLKEDGCWVSKSSPESLQENTLLAVLTKDLILSEVEMLVLKRAVKDILSYGLIKVEDVHNTNENGRGAR